MGRGSAPQGGAGNYGGSKSAKPKKPRNVTKSYKIKGDTNEQPEDTPAESTAAFTMTRPDRERRADLLRAHRRDEVAAARAAALSRRPVNGTSSRGEVLGGDMIQEIVASVESLREVRLQHFAKQQMEIQAEQACLPGNRKSSPQSSTATLSDPSPVLLSEHERRRALEALLRQPNVDSWHRSRDLRDGVQDEVDDIRSDELRVLVLFLLDTLSDRLRELDVAHGVRLIKTVLSNATKGDPKYHRLRASNSKLWAGLLQHPELCILLQVAGFQKSTEEQDRRRELAQLEINIQELLQSSEKVDEAKVDVLLQRMEELTQNTIPCDTSEEIENGSDFLVGRMATFIHPASEMLLGDLALVLEALEEWTPLSAEDDSQELHASNSSGTINVPRSSNEATPTS